MYNEKLVIKLMKYAVATLLFSFLLHSCTSPSDSDFDITAPVITLVGASSVNISIGGDYIDAGIQAIDNVDGDISNNVQIDNPVDTNTPGTYTIRFNVSDNTGNSAVEVTRTVVVTNPNNWTNELAKNKYLEVAQNICQNNNPVYLGLGIEVNTYYGSNPEDFDRFVEQYKIMYDTIKASSDCPDVKIFVTFQLERLKGLGLGVGYPGISQWEIFEKFDGKLDLLVFTSYPEFEYIDPNNIPANYYDSIYDNLPQNLQDKKIGISELGWNSEQNLISGASNSIAVQAAFINRFAVITNTLNTNSKLEFVTWIFMHDFQIGDFMVGSSFGLKDDVGNHKEITVGYTMMDQFLELKSSQGITVGVAPIPRNFLTSTQEDWLDMYSIVDGTFDIITAQSTWYESNIPLGQIPRGIQDFYEAREIYTVHDAILLYGINFHDPGNGDADLMIPGL